MAHYGDDFSGGRFTRRPSGAYGGDYDSVYGGMGRGLTGSQGAGWYGWGGERGVQRGWDDFGYGGAYHDRGEAGGSFSPRPGRSEFGGEGWHEFDRSRPGGFGRFGQGYQSPGYGSTGYGSNRYGSAGYGTDRGMAGGMNREYASRDVQFGNRPSHEYDADFGDRVRRGWNRFRDEARSWMGRGYDRGW